MATVYLAHDLRHDRSVAIKVLDPQLAALIGPERFLREIQTAARLTHPHILPVHDSGAAAGLLYYVMPHVEGESLRARLERERQLPLAEAVRLTAEAARALDHAHAKGVIHRDIKPANMMLTPARVVKLMDFGIAKAASDRKLTVTGTTMGSLYYMSPEQIQGSTSLDARSDLYSVGVSLYELVTGKRPFDGDSQYAIMAAHLEKTPIPPIQIDPRMPQVLNDAILMSVAKDPNARFQGAAAFRNALGSVSAPAPKAQAATVAMQGAPHAAPDAAPRTHSKRGLWMALGAVAAALAVVGVIEFGPKKGTKAAPQIPTPLTTQTTPPVQTPTVTPPQLQTPPARQPAQQQYQQAPPSLAPMSPAPKNDVPPVRTAPVQRAAQQTPIQQPPVQQPPIPSPTTCRRGGTRASRRSRSLRRGRAACRARPGPPARAGPRGRPPLASRRGSRRPLPGPRPPRPSPSARPARRAPLHRAWG